jgi:hypothetical protein
MLCRPDREPAIPFAPQLAERMRTALRARAGVVEKKMFGGCCWMLHMQSGTSAAFRLSRRGAHANLVQFHDSIRGPSPTSLNLAGGE